MTEHFLKMEHAADPRLGWDFLISNQPFRVTGPGAIAVRQVAENLRSDNGRSAWSTTRPKASETSKVKTCRIRPTLPWLQVSLMPFREIVFRLGSTNQSPTRKLEPMMFPGSLRQPYAAD